MLPFALAWLLVGQGDVAASSHRCAVQDPGPAPAATVASLQALLAEGNFAAVRQGAERCIDALLAGGGSLGSQDIATLRDLGELAGRAGDFRLSKRALAAALAAQRSHAGADEAAIAKIEASLAVAHGLLEEWTEAYPLLQNAVRFLTERRRPGDVELESMRGNLAQAMRAIGETDAARDLQRDIVTQLEATTADDHDALQKARGNLALSLRAAGDHRGACATFAKMIAIWEKSRPAGDLDLLRTRMNYASTLSHLGDNDAARQQYERALADCAANHPEDHPMLYSLRSNWAVERKRHGDLQGALRLQRDLLDSLADLPDEHPKAIAARRNLALTLRDLGDHAEALALQESNIAMLNRCRPTSVELLESRRDRAVTLRKMGRLDEAHREYDGLLEVAREQLPAGDSLLFASMGGFAALLVEEGDLLRGRELLEQALAAIEGGSAVSREDILATRTNLGSTLFLLGDLPRARIVQHQVLADLRARLPDDSSRVVDAKMNLALTLQALGEHSSAAAMLREVATQVAAALPPTHLRVLQAKTNLAGALADLEDAQSALAMTREVLDAAVGSLATGHPLVLGARTNVAGLLLQLEDYPQALVASRAALEMSRGVLPPTSPTVVTDLRNLAWSCHGAGEKDELRSTLTGLATALLAGLSELGDVSRREVRERLDSRAADRSCLVTLSRELPEIASLAFEVIENTRAVGIGSQRPMAEADDQWLGLDKELRQVRARVHTLATSADGATRPGETEELADLVAQRDLLESKLRHVARHGVAHFATFDVKALASRLAPDARAVGFAEFSRGSPEPGVPTASTMDLAAFVVAPDASVQRVNLGPLSAIATLVAAWRQEIRRPVDAPARGNEVPGRDPDGATANAGVRLRQAVLDPVLAKCGSSTRLHVCGDGPLHQVSLDALPLADGFVGDRYRIHVEMSFLRLLGDRGSVTGEPSMLCVGGIDYDATPSVPADGTLVAPPRRPGSDESRVPWPPLPGTVGEIADVAACFAQAFGRSASQQTGASATKERLGQQAGSARYLHIATHGWFESPEVPPRRAGDLPTASRRSGTAATLAPLALCGFVLAGANCSAEQVGNRLGILSAEELCSWDLRACELAVLSACQTSVGHPKSGQGLSSLQVAFHLAGARTTVASLWSVDDAATKKLMARFYSHLWVGKTGKAEALWRAKCDLRKEGHGVVDWGAWILTGDPE